MSLWHTVAELWCRKLCVIFFWNTLYMYLSVWVALPRKLLNVFDCNFPQGPRSLHDTASRILLAIAQRVLPWEPIRLFSSVVSIWQLFSLATIILQLFTRWQCSCITTMGQILCQSRSDQLVLCLILWHFCSVSCCTASLKHKKSESAFDVCTFAVNLSNLSG